ncbi:hypothetical protein OW492_05000 [Psychromonas sp. 14N.309.X.WAT.B.A12]|uniref:hypothetical protein n=1 Tax=Psychromonas sp. 14N.309.X.WAT.B.A12 TaxID=2998322 RepID=UPI0025B0B1BA|nr:hypothetical protein [Psychromonas sp. 14N.309.X.WAT.B.A12]MDN2662731.1 hypothetical protein [Psychromonas sp. 14N.309.X.WAT.B.A12]
MNSNDVLIIILAIIALPLGIYLLIVMPNDKHCNDCNSDLSPHRQKTFHCKIKGEDKEICKRCYSRRFGRS